MSTQLSKFRMALLATAVLVGFSFSGTGMLSGTVAMAQQVPNQTAPLQQVPIQPSPELQTLSFFVQFVKSLHLFHHKSTPAPQTQLPQAQTTQTQVPQTELKQDQLSQEQQPGSLQNQLPQQPMPQN